jgi:hypothetical protein
MDLLQPLENALSMFLSYLPQLIGAIIILVIGYIVAVILQKVVARILQAVGFDGWMERGGIKQFFDRAQTQETPASVIGKLIFWFVFIITITMATDALGIPQVSQVLGQLLAYIPNIIAAILILILAALLANFVAGLVRGVTGYDFLATAARVVIIVYAVFAALTQLRIAVELTAPTFLIVLGAVALAAALAFGIGGREVARDLVEKAYNRGQDVTENVADSAGRSTSAAGSGGTESERPEARRLRRDE